MERVFIYLQTERDMKEHYMMELNKEMENITISMEIFMMVNGLMIEKTGLVIKFSL